VRTKGGVRPENDAVPSNLIGLLLGSLFILILSLHLGVSGVSGADNSSVRLLFDDGHRPIYTISYDNPGPSVPMSEQPKGAYSQFYGAYLGHGYDCDLMNFEEPVLYNRLKQSDIFYVRPNHAYYSDAEIETIRQYYHDGGAVVIFLENKGLSWGAGELATELGVRPGNADLKAVLTSVPGRQSVQIVSTDYKVGGSLRADHPLFEGVEDVYFRMSNHIADYPAWAEPLAVGDDGRVYIVHVPPLPGAGIKGELLVFADMSIFDNAKGSWLGSYMIDVLDHRRLLANIPDFLLDSFGVDLSPQQMGDDLVRELGHGDMATYGLTLSNTGEVLDGLTVTAAGLPEGWEYAIRATFPDGEDRAVFSGDAIMVPGIEEDLPYDTYINLPDEGRIRMPASVGTPVPPLVNITVEIFPPGHLALNQTVALEVTITSGGDPELSSTRTLKAAFRVTRGIELSTDQTVYFARPGEEAVFHFTASNMGTLRDSVSFFSSSPIMSYSGDSWAGLNWSPATSIRWGPFESDLPIDSQTQAYLSFTLPQGALPGEEARLTFTASSFNGSSESVELLISVLPRPSVLLDIPRSSFNVTQGGNVSIPVRLINDGNTQEQVSWSLATSDPDGTLFAIPEFGPSDRWTVDPGMVFEGNLVVTCKEGGYSPVPLVVEIIGDAPGVGVTLEGNVSVTIREQHNLTANVTGPLLLNPDTPPAGIGSGRTSSTSIRLINSGNVNESLVLGVYTDIAGWNVTFDGHHDEPSGTNTRVELAPFGSAELLDLTLRVAGEPMAGSGTVRVRVSSGNTPPTFEPILLDVPAAVLPDPGLSVTASPVSYTLMPGGTTMGILTLRNTGNVPLDLDLSGMQGWVIPMVNSTSLGPYSETTIAIQVEPPRSEEAGDQMVDIEVTGNLDMTLLGTPPPGHEDLFSVDTVAADDEVEVHLVLPDLTMRTVIIPTMQVGQTAVIRATVENSGDVRAQNVHVSLRVDGQPAGEKILRTILPNARSTAVFVYLPPSEVSEVSVVIDPDDSIPEVRETDNAYTGTATFLTDAQGGMLSDPVILGGGVGVIIILVAVVAMVSRGRRAGGKDDDDWEDEGIPGSDSGYEGVSEKGYGGTSDPGPEYDDQGGSEGGSPDHYQPQTARPQYQAQQFQQPVQAPVQHTAQQYQQRPVQQPARQPVQPYQQPIQQPHFQQPAQQAQYQQPVQRPMVQQPPQQPRPGTTPAPLFCRGCGNPLGFGVTFCNRCGTQV